MVGFIESSQQLIGANNLPQFDEEKQWCVELKSMLVLF